MALHGCRFCVRHAMLWIEFLLGLRAFICLKTSKQSTCPEDKPGPSKPCCNIQVEEGGGSNSICFPQRLLNISGFKIESVRTLPFGIPFLRHPETDANSISKILATAVVPPHSSINFPASGGLIRLFMIEILVTPKYFVKVSPNFFCIGLPKYGI